jgi:hypothetical protein
MFTIKNSDKVLISYLGGSAGALIGSMCNGVTPEFSNKIYVNDNDWSTKPHEPIGNVNILQKIIDAINYKFIVTHEYDIIASNAIPLISLEIDDAQLQEIIILRQMFLQRLKIQVDSGHWFEIVKKLCLANKHNTAAKFWFAQAQQHWLTEMNRRIGITTPFVQKININHLFENTFVYTLQAQNLTINIPHSIQLHNAWLEKNQKSAWTYERTINSMTNKLQKMDWNQLSGQIIYND